MKRFTFFSMSLLILLAFSTACETTSSDSSTAESEATIDGQNSRGLEMTDTDVIVNCPESPIIDSTVAIARINAFVALSDTTEFVCGFQLSCGDVDTLDSYRDPDNEYPIYAMYAYDTDSSQFDLIFRTKKVVDEVPQFTYFDFTKPCPSYCPSTDDCKNPPTKGQLNGVTGYWLGKEGMDQLLGAAEGEELSLMLRTNEWDKYLVFVLCDSANKNCEETKIELGPCGPTGDQPCPSFD